MTSLDVLRDAYHDYMGSGPTVDDGLLLDLLDAVDDAVRPLFTESGKPVLFPTGSAR